MDAKSAVWVTVGIVASGLAWSVLSKAYERKNRRILLAQREPLSEAAILAQFPNDPDHAVEVLRAWNAIARALHVSPSRLRADDEIAKLSGVPAWISPPISSYFDTGALVETVFACLPENTDASRVTTVRGIVRCALEFPDVADALSQ